MVFTIWHYVYLGIVEVDLRKDFPEGEFYTQLFEEGDKVEQYNVLVSY
jgi:hypothetical protein